MASKFIKQQVTSISVRRALIRGNHYHDGLNWILEMFEEAKRDIPTLTHGDISVVKYGGDTIKGIIGIEFSIDISILGYETIARMPLTL